LFENSVANAKDYPKSIEAHLAALKIREHLFGSTGAEVIQSYTNLGRAYRANQDYATSLMYFEKTLQNKIAQRGEGHKELAPFYKNISDVYYLMDNRAEGDRYKALSDEILQW
jgi:tetratricopeptide (TPR) repeat protein